VARSGSFGSAAAVALATRFSVLLDFTAPQMTRIKIRIPTQADFILWLTSSCAPLLNGPGLSSRPGPKSAYGTKRSIDPNQLIDPVAAAFVTSLARPDANITGITNF
jgi:hypothetical protein